MYRCQIIWGFCSYLNANLFSSKNATIELLIVEEIFQMRKGANPNCVQYPSRTSMQLPHWKEFSSLLPSAEGAGTTGSIYPMDTIFPITLPVRPQLHVVSND